MREGWREKERKSPADAMLSVEPDLGFDPRPLRSWLEPKSVVDAQPDESAGTQETVLNHNRMLKTTLCHYISELRWNHFVKNHKWQSSLKKN